MKLGNIIVVGCGGIGSYLVPPLSRVAMYGVRPKPAMLLFDGDTVEHKNLQRQQFIEEHVGHAKVDIACAMCPDDMDVRAIREYLHEGMELPPNSVILVCVDNHAARKSALSIADRQELPVIIVANEVNSAQGYIYFPEWKDTPLDPRVRFPEILTDESDDPVKASAGCNEHETLVKTGGQTAIANFMAASFALQLFQAHFIEGKKLEREFRNELPLSLESNFFAIKTTKIKEIKV